MTRFRWTDLVLLSFTLQWTSNGLTTPPPQPTPATCSPLQLAGLDQADLDAVLAPMIDFARQVQPVPQPDAQQGQERVSPPNGPGQQHIYIVLWKTLDNTGIGNPPRYIQDSLEQIRNPQNPRARIPVAHRNPANAIRAWARFTSNGIPTESRLLNAPRIWAIDPANNIVPVDPVREPEHAQGGDAVVPARGTWAHEQIRWVATLPPLPLGAPFRRVLLDMTAEQLNTYMNRLWWVQIPSPGGSSGQAGQQASTTSQAEEQASASQAPSASQKSFTQGCNDAVQEAREIVWSRNNDARLTYAQALELVKNLPHSQPQTSSWDPYEQGRAAGIAGFYQFFKTQSERDGTALISNDDSWNNNNICPAPEPMSGGATARGSYQHKLKRLRQEAVEGQRQLTYPELVSEGFQGYCRPGASSTGEPPSKQPRPSEEAEDMQLCDEELLSMIRDYAREFAQQSNHEEAWRAAGIIDQQTQSLFQPVCPETAPVQAGPSRQEEAPLAPSDQVGPSRQGETSQTPPNQAGPSQQGERPQDSDASPEAAWDPNYWYDIVREVKQHFGIPEQELLAGLDSGPEWLQQRQSLRRFLDGEFPGFSEVVQFAHEANIQFSSCVKPEGKPSTRRRLRVRSGNQDVCHRVHKVLSGHGKPSPAPKQASSPSSSSISTAPSKPPTKDDTSKPPRKDDTSKPSPKEDEPPKQVKALVPQASDNDSSGVSTALKVGLGVLFGGTSTIAALGLAAFAATPEGAAALASVATALGLSAEAGIGEAITATASRAASSIEQLIRGPLQRALARAARLSREAEVLITRAGSNAVRAATRDAGEMIPLLDKIKVD
ncbi:hypothetical protein CDD81_2669 [Ophiocordyceps australis]|uniref:Enterotoxin n=1 Tax=Ophiocordyceps australis TaxID=1399860 RepID=A0A2C5XTB1_9HYPO|nr:hypothetical protein CDD81_2669 [Ophiocordyceps australis]